MAVPSGVDPHEVRGVATGAPPADVTAAYRRLAKRWHPDRAPAPGAADRMALINAAYDELRGEDGPAGARSARSTGGRAPAPGPSWGAGGPDDAPPVWPPPGPRPAPGPVPPRSGPGRGDAPPRGTGPGGWAAGVFATAEEDAAGAAPDGLTPALRSALGAELRSALQPGEAVGIVVPTSTWASPQTTLAVTDRRLLWLLDDAPVHRVRVLALADVVAVAVRPPRLWRPRSQVVVTDRRGRSSTFGELEPPTADAVARRVRAGGPPATGGPAARRRPAG